MVDVDGKLRLELTPGVYTVNVQSFGFASLKRRLEVQIASPQTVSVVLQPYSCSDGCGLEYSSLLLDPSLATSPDRRFAILEDVHARPDHKFFLIDRDFTTQRKLFSSSKPVKALWGYDSRAIVVTDYPHGDIYHTKVFPVDVNLPPIRLLDLIARQLTETEREDLEGRLSRLHITIEALKWVKQTELELTLSGFDDKAQKNFKETYVLPIDFHAGSTAPIWPK